MLLRSVRPRNDHERRRRVEDMARQRKSLLFIGSDITFRQRRTPMIRVRRRHRGEIGCGQALEDARR